MILILDNYDSLVYNLAQHLREMAAEVRVARNDALTVAEVLADPPQALLVASGPGRPETAGIACDLIRALAGRLPILGVGLGHLAIGHVCGARIVRAARLMHGKVSEVTADGLGLFDGVRSPFKAMRYHSLAVAREALPPDLAISAASEDGEIMGIRHRAHPLEGVQFDPASIMTPAGKRLLRNFLRQADGRG